MMSKAKRAMLLLLVLGVIGLWPRDADAAKYEYDALNRLTRVVYDEGTVIEYNYDAVGNRTRRISTLMADTAVNGKVDFEDYAALASRWLEEDCGYPDDWCDRADIDWSSQVDWQDIAILAQLWLQDIGP